MSSEIAGTLCPGGSECLVKTGFPEIFSLYRCIKIGVQRPDPKRVFPAHADNGLEVQAPLPVFRTIQYKFQGQPAGIICKGELYHTSILMRQGVKKLCQSAGFGDKNQPGSGVAR